MMATAKHKVADAPANAVETEDGHDHGGDGDWNDARGAASLSSVAIRRGTAMPTPDAPADIIAYWTSLRQGDAVPAPSALDERHVTAHWPGSVLMRLVGGTPILVRRFARPTDGGTGAVAAMQIQWIQSLTREAVRSGCALRDDTSFPAGTLGAGETRCRGIAVPLGDDAQHPDHALCWVMTEP